jgi:hypothetical protein
LDGFVGNWYINIIQWFAFTPCINHFLLLQYINDNIVTYITKSVKAILQKFLKKHKNSNVRIVNTYKEFLFRNAPNPSENRTVSRRLRGTKQSAKRTGSDNSRHCARIGWLVARNWQGMCLYGAQAFRRIKAWRMSLCCQLWLRNSQTGVEMLCEAEIELILHTTKSNYFFWLNFFLKEKFGALTQGRKVNAIIVENKLGR